MDWLINGGGIAYIIFLFVSLALFISPLFIWRNGNRTNRLLTLIAKNQGIPEAEVKRNMKGRGRMLAKLKSRITHKNT